MSPAIVTRSEQETEDYGRLLAASLSPADVVYLEGSLGAGKTCLARGVARGLGAPAVDSRDGLRSHEHELAAHGITWQTDADDDRTLADQLRAARHARLSAPAGV